MVYLSSSKIGVEQGITTRTLQSGLIERSGKIICHQSAVDASIVQLKNDFSNIYPDPTIRFRNDGLAEIDWSSYATGTGLFPPNFGTELLTVSKSFSLLLPAHFNDVTLYDRQYDWTITEQWLCDVVVEKFTLDVVQTTPSLITPSALFLDKKQISQHIVGVLPPLPSEITQPPIISAWPIAIRSIDRNNYGEVEAVSVVTGYLPQLSK